LAAGFLNGELVARRHLELVVRGPVEQDGIRSRLRQQAPTDLERVPVPANGDVPAGQRAIGNDPVRLKPRSDPGIAFADAADLLLFAVDQRSTPNFLGFE
jgi:hypothetical protein